MFYIQENDKPNTMERLFDLVKVERNKIIVPLRQENLTLKKQEKLANKTIKILNRSHSKKIVLSKKLANYEKFINILEQQNYINVTGKWLYKMIIPEMVDYILKKENWKKEEINIFFLVNDVTDVVIENIKQFAKEFKLITIITNHIDKFKKIEEKIYEELGIYITVMNNKKKGLSRAKLIINMDFPKELLNKYNINEKAIILSIPNNVKINKKRFEGKIIKDYEIKLQDEEEYHQEFEKFDQKVIYESKFYYEQPYRYVREKIQKDKVSLKNLYLQNGIY